MTFVRSPRVTVFPDARTAARVVAARIAAALREKPGLVLGLPTGRTPIALYKELAQLTAARDLDWSSATTFNLDEVIGVDQADPGSYRQFMERHLFQYVNVRPERINFLHGTADPEDECRRYERAIAAADGIDMQVLGIGTNGHIGFNEPGRVLQSRTHRVTLKHETRRSNATLFGGDPERVPTEALSMGMATILQARSVILMANGQSKARCIERVVNGPLTTHLPASFLQLHHDVDVILDTGAASALEMRDAGFGIRDSGIRDTGLGIRD
ncbi:MAG: glucosamine-6-phosphate deaminase [Vicinamibacterales bacterium]